MASEQMAYVARCACGAVVAAVIDDPNYRRDTAREVAAWIRGGLVVERMTVDEAREQWRPCTCEAQPALPGMS